MGCTNNALDFFAISARNVATTKKMSLSSVQSRAWGGGGGGGYPFPPPPLYQSLLVHLELCKSINLEISVLQ